MRVARVDGVLVAQCSCEAWQLEVSPDTLVDHLLETLEEHRAECLTEMLERE